MPSLVVIGPQIKENRRGGGAQCAYMVPKDPSLNRVRSCIWKTFYTKSFKVIIT